MKEKILWHRRKQESPGAIKQEEPVSEAQRKTRRWRKASMLALAAANNCIYGMKKSGARINGLDVQAFWLGPNLFVKILGFDPPPEVDKTP